MNFRDHIGDPYEAKSKAARLKFISITFTILLMCIAGLVNLYTPQTATPLIILSVLPLTLGVMASLVEDYFFWFKTR